MKTQNYFLDGCDDAAEHDDDQHYLPCEGCGKVAYCEVIPFHGYSKRLCSKCWRAAYASHEAV